MDFHVWLQRESILGDAQRRLVRLYYAGVVVGDTYRHRHIGQSEVQDLRSEPDRSK